MPTHILMNVVDDHEMRVAVIKDGRLDSLIHERQKEDGQALGNIYLAKVANVEPSLDAAFLDLGTGKNGFIHVDDIRHDKSSGSRIEDVVKSGQQLLVQITKEAIRDKGPCVSMYLSLPGRCLVLMPTSEGNGVSRRIEDPLARKRLRRVLASIDAPEGFGFIVRTAGADCTDEEIHLDSEYLLRVWSEVSGRAERARAPACVYQEGDVVLRTLRDTAPTDVEAVIIDQDDLYHEARAFAQVLMPEIAGRIQLHRDDLPLFTYYGVEERLSAIFDRQAELPSGGNVVIEQTEAMVSIDVNSARNKGGADVGETALLTNMEAVTVIAEQLVLRDLGGLIIIDFIDMEDREHRRLVHLALRRVLAKDKARTQVAPMSRFGLIEMTRQRTRPSHKLISSTECPSCRGTGRMKTSETFEIDCMREIRMALARQSLARLEVVVPRDLSIGLLNNRRREIARLEDQHDCRISFVGDELMKVRECRLVPTVRKRARRRKEGEPVRPALLASQLEDRARALAEAKALAAKKPEELERELERIAEGLPPEEPAKTQPERIPVAETAVVHHVPPLVAVGTELRRLLFSPNTPIAVGGSTATLAKADPTAKSRRSPRERARRRRR